MLRTGILIPNDRENDYESPIGICEPLWSHIAVDEELNREKFLPITRKEKMSMLKQQQGS